MVHGVFTGPDGLIRITGDDTHRVTCTIRVVVTERRVLFVADSPGGGVEAGSLAYGELASVGVKDGTIVFTTTDGTRFELGLPESPSETIEAARRHLCWLGQVRSQIIACKNDLELTVGEIRDHASAREWALASGEYESLRETLDRLIVAVQWTEPVPDAALAPELTEMEETLERARARTLLERARSELELGRQLLENDDCDRAWPVLTTAIEYHDRAKKRAGSIEPPDAFRFGEQRELHEEIEQVGDEIESVAAEPIERAREQRETARDADGPGVEALETALDLYDGVFEMASGRNDRYLPGDREDARLEKEAVADQLVTRHCQLARKAWDSAVEHRDDGEVKRALRECEMALSHQERATDLATDVRQHAVEAIENRHQQMKEEVDEIRDTADAETTPETGAIPGVDDTTDEGDSSGDGTGRDELTDIDTHQEITLDATVEDESSNATLDIQQPPRTLANARDANPLVGTTSHNGNNDGSEESGDEEDLEDLKKAIIQSDPGDE